MKFETSSSSVAETAQSYVYTSEESYEVETIVPPKKILHNSLPERVKRGTSVEIPPYYSDDDCEETPNLHKRTLSHQKKRVLHKRVLSRDEKMCMAGRCLCGGLTLFVVVMFSAFVMWNIMRWSACRDGGYWYPDVKQCLEPDPPGECIQTKAYEGDSPYILCFDRAEGCCTRREMEKYISLGGSTTTIILSISIILVGVLTVIAVSVIVYRCLDWNFSFSENDNVAFANGAMLASWLSIGGLVLVFIIYGIAYGVNTSLFGKHTDFDVDAFQAAVLYFTFGAWGSSLLGFIAAVLEKSGMCR